MSILRTWTKAENSITWTQWDRGDELWELKGDILRHFAVVSRKMDGEVMREELRLMKDSPIPLEALRQEIQGWEVTELVSALSQKQTLPSSEMRPLPSQRAPQPLPRGPAFLPDHLQPQQPSQKNIEKSKSSNSKSESMQRQTQTSLTQSSHEKPLPLIQDSQEEQHSQQPCTLPAELWSSLSQWIPPSALFQPSLHHQAFLELSGTQAGTYPSQKDSENYSQRRQAQRQYVRQAQPSMPYHQQPSLQKIKPSSGPLFV